MTKALKRVFKGNAAGRPYVTAEMACAHEGSVGRALEIVQISSPADAIQIQLFHAETLVVPEKVSGVRQFELAPNSWTKVADKARSEGLDLWATVFDEEAVKLSLELDADVLKIHSTDLWNPRLLRACAESGLPISLSVGGAFLSEIQRTISFLEERGTQDIVLMHGFQAYPTPPGDARLGVIPVLDRLFPYPVGYQDHTEGSSELAYALPISAIGLGARVLEKHVTDDRSRQGTDYESAFGPNAFREFVEMVDHASGAFSGRRPDVLSKAEHAYRQSMQRRIVAQSDIMPGTPITEDVITLLRSDDGLPARKLNDVLGRTSSCRIRSGEVVTKEHLA